MAYAIGLTLAMGLSAFAGAVGLDRERAYYPLVAIVVASYYVLFAVMGGAASAIVAETAVMAAFTLVAVFGLIYDLRLAIVAVAAHGIFDGVHAHVMPGSAVPAWWPPFCGSFDVAAAAYWAWRRVKTA